VSRFSDTKFPNANGDLMLEVASRRLEAQLATVDALDTKTGVALAIARGSIVAVGAVVAATPERVRTVGFVLIALTVLTYAAQAIISVRAIKPRTWGVGLEPDEIFELCNDRGVSEQKRAWVVAEGYAKAVTVNKPALDQKASQSRAGLYVLLLQTGLLLTCLLALSYRV